MKQAKKYFISGLLFILPMWVLYIIVKSLAGLITSVIEINVFIAFVVSLFVITGIGFVVRRIIKHYVGKHIKQWSTRPGIFGFAMKQFMQIDGIAEKTRAAFSNPILYKVDDGIYKLGFITDADIDILDSLDPETDSEANPSQESVWVYAPLPVTMLGELILVEQRKIQKISAAQQESIPLFIFSAGLIETR